jgi:hypothetical protein
MSAVEVVGEKVLETSDEDSKGDMKELFNSTVCALF